MMTSSRRIALASLLALPWAADARAQPTDYASDTSRIEGKILGADGKPIEGARLLSYHLSSEQLFTSEPTQANGEYVLDSLPFGYHDLAVATDEGLFVSSQVVNLSPNAKLLVVLTLLPTPGDTVRAYPGSEQDPIGQAQVVERLRGRAFWRSPRGVAVIAGSGAVALLLLAGGGGSDDEPASSPF